MDALPPAVVSPAPPELSPLALQAFCNDIARQIHPAAEIAARYGFADKRAARDWIDARPAVKRVIKELRAIWESEANLEGRIRAYAGHALLEAAPTNAQIMLDPTVHPTIRIDAMKAHAKIAGVDTLPAAARDGGGGVPGNAPFAVNIIFQQAGMVESIATVRPPPKDPGEIEGEAA